MVLIAPVTATAGPMVAYGLLVLATLTAAGMLAWRLGLAMGLGTVGSAVAGMLWMSSPIVVHRTTERPVHAVAAGRAPPGGGAARAPARAPLLEPLRRRSRRAFRACLLTDLQVTAYLVLAVSAVGVYAVVTEPRWRSRAALVRVGVVAAVFVAIGIPVLAMTVRAETDGTYRTPTSARVASATTYSGDAAQLLLPSPASRFFRSWYERAADDLGSLSSFTFDSSIARLSRHHPGAGRRRRDPEVEANVVARRRRGGLRRAVGQAHAQGIRSPPHSARGRPRRGGLAAGPVNAWLLGIPVVNDLRIPARYMQLGALPLALLAGLGAQAIVRRSRIAGTAPLPASALWVSRRAPSS